MSMLYCALFCLGCGTSTPPAAAPPKPTQKPATPLPTVAKPPVPAKVASPSSKPPAEPQVIAPAKPAVPSKPSFVAEGVDPATLAAHGLRQIVGARLILVTDVPASAEVDALPQLFEQAYPQWCAYFDQNAERDRPWRMRGCLMLDVARFRAAGLLGGDVPKFLNGYARGIELWLYEQPTPYYRAHLLLHEGTHAFMNTVLGGGGPPWYVEGTAELLATHRLSAGKLELNSFPERREDVPQLGRIKIVQDDVDARKLLQVDEILNYSASAHLRTEPYGWCWALAAYLDGDERYRGAWRGMSQQLPQPDFNERFRRALGARWKDMSDGWQAFAAELDHRYDRVRAAIEFAPGEPLAPAGRDVSVRADRSWQSTRIELKQGASYRLTAVGQCTLAEKPKPWVSEPGGVSIRYYGNLPLGTLLGVVRGEAHDPQQFSPFVRPFVVGLGTVFQAEATGTLYLRINDSPCELSDNTGEYRVHVEPVALK